MMEPKKNLVRSYGQIEITEELNCYVVWEGLFPMRVYSFHPCKDKAFEEAKSNARVFDLRIKNLHFIDQPSTK